MIRREIRTTPRKRLRWVPGQMVVSVKADALMPHVERAAATASLQSFPEGVAAPLERLRREGGMQAVSVVADASHGKTRASSEAALVEALTESARASDSAELQGMLVLDIRATDEVRQLARELDASDAFDFAEPFPARWPAARPHASVDPTRNLQWHLRATRWFDAEIPDARGVTVAVLDSGIDRTHPQLEAAIRSYEHFGWKADDILGHGSHVAGIIASRRDGNVAMTGLAKCNLAVWKVFNDTPEDDEFYIDADSYVTALRAVETSGAVALNLSLGGYESSDVERILFRRIIDRGIAVVAAMGNEYEEDNSPEYPAAYDDVIGVGAMDESLRRAEFSNTGRHIALVAPGTNIFSTVPRRASDHRRETQATAWDGTSMATPQIVAAIALLHASEGAMSVADVTDRITAAVTPLEEMKGRKRTFTCGSGLLDLAKLLGRKA